MPIASTLLRLSPDHPPDANLRRGARHILARRLYAALGSKGIYTRRKGLDRDTNKALLLKHIRDNARTGARMAEFRQVLPALSRSEIQVLLRELRAEQAVHNTGRTKAARWFPGPDPDCNPSGAPL